MMMPTTQQPRTTARQRMLNVLADWKKHQREELRLCLDDSLSDYIDVAPHLTALRNDLRHRGVGIHCDRVRGIIFYQLVLLNIPDDMTINVLPI